MLNSKRRTLKKTTTKRAARSAAFRNKKKAESRQKNDDLVKLSKLKKGLTEASMAERQSQLNRLLFEELRDRSLAKSQAAEETMPDFGAMTVPELKAYARDVVGMSGYSKLLKTDLVHGLEACWGKSYSKEYWENLSSDSQGTGNE